MLLDPEGVTRARPRRRRREARRAGGRRRAVRARRSAASRSGWCSRRRSRPARRSSPPTSRATATSSRDGRDGLLVPRGDATRLAETLRDLALDPARTRAPGRRGAGRSAERYAWPRVAAEVAATYEDARAVERPEGALARAAVRVGARAADGERARPRGGCRRSSRRSPGTARPALQAAAPRAARPPRRWPRPAARRWRSSGSACAPIGQALLASSPTWVLVALGADVPVDVPARRLLARDPQGGAARRAAALRRRDAGHLDRRADVGDAARPARRALARADRLPPARPRARPAAGRARHARLPDAAQRARAGDPRRA